MPVNPVFFFSCPDSDLQWKRTNDHLYYNIHLLGQPPSTQFLLTVSGSSAQEQGLRLRQLAPWLPPIDPEVDIQLQLVKSWSVLEIWNSEPSSTDLWNCWTWVSESVSWREDPLTAAALTPELWGSLLFLNLSSSFFPYILLPCASASQLKDIKDVSRFWWLWIKSL